jgi:hypothetical protein
MMVNRLILAMSSDRSSRRHPSRSAGALGDTDHEPTFLAYAIGTDGFSRPGRAARTSGRLLAVLLAASVAATGLVVVTTGVAAAQPAPSAPPTPPPPGPAKHRNVGVLFRMNFDFGGDEIAEVAFSDGSSDRLMAGTGFSASAGVFYHPARPWAVELTLGVKFDGTDASNGSIEFVRFPIDLVVSAAAGRLRFGAGPTLHLAPSIDCDRGLCGAQTTIEFHNAIGGLVQLGFGFPRGDHGWDLGLRYTRIQYSLDGFEPLDGSSFGFFLSGWL